MRVYSASDEENIRDGNLVREWAASGLLDSAQRTALLANLKTELRQTNVFLRAVSFVFSALIVISGVALFGEALRPTQHSEWMTLFLISGSVCWLLAEYACWHRLYRFGAEESLAVISVVFFSIGVAELFQGSSVSEAIAGLLVASLGGVALYVRFGFVYAAVAALVAAAAIPFQWNGGVEAKRMIAAMFFACIIGLIQLRRKNRPDEPAGSARSAIEAAAWLGVYLMLNLQLTTLLFGVPDWIFYSPVRTVVSESHTWFYVLTWALIWILPAASMWTGVRKKERMLIDVSILMALLTLSTNKRYLGWTVHSWDPIVLGMLLMTTAILLRRWLQRGSNGAQNGFTADRLLRSDERNLGALSIMSAALGTRGMSPAKADAPAGFHEGGGKSGGGGATGNF